MGGGLLKGRLGEFVIEDNQYTLGGISCCGIASTEVILQCIYEKDTDEKLLGECLNTASQYKDESHLSIKDILSLGRYKKTLDTSKTQQPTEFLVSEAQNIITWMEELVQKHKKVGLIISKQPEIVSVYLQLCENDEIFVLYFDSHGNRQGMLPGAHFIIFETLKNLLEFFEQERFPLTEFGSMMLTEEIHRYQFDCISIYSVTEQVPHVPLESIPELDFSPILAEYYSQENKKLIEENKKLKLENSELKTKLSLMDRPYQNGHNGWNW